MCWATFTNMISWGGLGRFSTSVAACQAADMASALVPLVKGYFSSEAATAKVIDFMKVSSN